MNQLAVHRYIVTDDAILGSEPIFAAHTRSGRSLKCGGSGFRRRRYHLISLT